MGCQVTLYDHQRQTIAKGLAAPSAHGAQILFDASDPGTGKTIASLAIFDERLERRRAKRLLVVCPKSIMTLAWGRDTMMAFPNLSFTVAGAGNREAAFNSNARIVIINHDGIVWLKNNTDYLEGFTDLVIDESTAFKNRTASRSKAMRLIADLPNWKYKAVLTGTPMPLSVTDIWHQVMILDKGIRLGNNFYGFQSACCDAKQNGPSAKHLKWTDKEGIADIIHELLRDIMVRHKLEDCIDIPPNHVISLPLALSAKFRAQYETLKREAVLACSGNQITAFHAGTLRTKLLQLLSGAVYHSETEYTLLDEDRYNLVLDLVEQRKASLVAFIWKHQRDEITRLANDRGIHFAVIDGETSDLARIQIIDSFQRGELKFVLGHPRTMSHGITMTYGTATIWPSPTDNAEHFIQMNRRVYRNGQQADTETILIHAENTLEEPVYERLQGKVSRQAEFLALAELFDIPELQPQNSPETETPT